MSTKKKYRLEYLVKSSPKILFNFISTPSGLEEWFADKVAIHNSHYEFYWGTETKHARLLSIKENKSVKFKWEDDDPYCFFEFEILLDDITGDIALAITDFAAEKDREGEILIWNNNVEALMHVIGG